MPKINYWNWKLWHVFSFWKKTIFGELDEFFIDFFFKQWAFANKHRNSNDYDIFVESALSFLCKSIFKLSMQKLLSFFSEIRLSFLSKTVFELFVKNIFEFFCFTKNPNKYFIFEHNQHIFGDFPNRMLVFILYFPKFWVFLKTSEKLQKNFRMLLSKHFVLFFKS